MQKFIISFALITWSFLAIAQFPDGNYKTTNPFFSKIELLNRKDGTIKGTFNRVGASPLTLVLRPVNKEKTIYETTEKALKNSFFQIAKVENNMALYEFNNQRLIKSEAALGQTGKQIKGSTKYFGFKSALQLQMESLKEEKDREMPTKFLVKNPTSIFHQKHVGEIVFFTQKPTIGKEDLSTVASEFKSGQPIWAIVYLPTALKNYEGLIHRYQDPYGKITHDLYVGIDKMDEDLEESERPIVNSATIKPLSENDLEKNYAVFQLLPSFDGENEMDEIGGQFLTKRFGERVGNYKHDLEICLTDAEYASRNSKAEMADIEIFKGYLEFDASEGTSIYADLAKKLEEEAIARKPLPTAIYSDSQIEAEMMSQMQLFIRNKGWDFDLYKAYIALDWQVIRDDYNQIIGKYIEANITYSSDEGCAFMNVGFIKKYMGNGEYNSSLQQYTTGERGPLSCDKLVR